ncbi:ABC transporter permease [Oribacterium sp. FC2011]|uniref:ABC transporter permease n=1 Tax=Oribacterium sp. FC2011 TaxID=1408311 RepID=UPI0004E22BD1|nr:ABC transporter permease [Oribacterium sp. FC2011]
MKKILIKLLGGEKLQMVRISLFSIIISLFVGAIIFIAMGKNPFSAYGNLLQGSGLLMKQKYAGRQNMFTDFMSFLDTLTPMIFAALAVAVALKAGLFNIGVSGMMLTAGFIATLTVGYSSLPAFLAKPLVLIIGAVSGALVGALIGWLKYRFNINEVVSSIMINYTLMYIFTFFINTFFLEPTSRQSIVIADEARLTLVNVKAFGLKFCIPLAFPLAIIVAILVRYLINRTTTGFEIQAVGLGKKAANYAGISISKNMMLAMIISGALAGLAGVTYFCGYNASIRPGVVPGMGFNAIAVALLGCCDPIGCIFASFLITAISNGSIYMSSQQGVEIEIADLITSVILIFAACSEFLRMYIEKISMEQNDKKDVKRV